ncbi:MAG: hypothetical protein IJH87_04755, partial [Atopobiaceae bacterium]|nr:hypothetical protein [Atopobiaceae bacterium]
VNQLRSIFVNGSALDVAVTEAERILDDEDADEDDYNRAIAILEEALAPADQMGVYLDDTEEVFRYFGSGVERLRFNLDIDDHSRHVVFVPDSYFRAHQLCSRLLNILERTDEARAHNEVLLRIAPASIDAILANVRTLERESRIFEAVEELIRGIKLSLSARDSALCLYRLAYMEWKLGNSELSAYCYTRALRWRTDIYDQALSELDDMIRDEELERPTGEQADKALVEAGIPLGVDDKELEILLAASIQCVDNGLFGIARAYLGTLYDITRNDTLVNVHRSLALKD